MTRIHTGVTFYEEDRGNGPFIIRIGGTRDFVSNILGGYYNRWGAPVRDVTMVEGWDHPDIIVYKIMDEALVAAGKVYEITGQHTSIEAVNESR